MTFVTVLVQHAWAMQPSTSAAQHPAPGQTGETAQTLPSGKKSGHRAIVPKIPTVRVSVPASVAEFVAVFNAVHALDATIAAGSGDVRADVIAAAVDRADAKARDVLARLEDLVLASSITNERVRTRPRATGDARRHDAMREAARARKAAWYKPRKGAAGGAGGADAGAGSDGRGTALRIQTRRYAAQARRSLLVLASARSRMLRRNCLALLVEALDTNELGFDDAEVASLLLLVKELGDMLESALAARRQQKTQAEPAEEQAISDAITVDNFLEAIATCISLAVQRLEYACDIKPFFIPTEMRSAFQRLFNENLCLLETNDLFAAQVISGAIETVHWLMRAKVETEELMATPVGLSLLSRITRMTPGLDIRGMLGAFTGILRDLKDKQEWHLGSKFVRLVATGATINHDCCCLLIDLIKHLQNLGESSSGNSSSNAIAGCWQWVHEGIALLGAAALTAECSQVRRLALEGGLLAMLETADGGGHSWRARATAAACVAEICVQCRGDPTSLLAREALRARAAVETDARVAGFLAVPAVTPHAVASTAIPRRRIQLLFKYVCLCLTESYSESQSRYSFLKSFVKSRPNTPGDTARKEHAKNAHGLPFLGKVAGGMTTDASEVSSGVKQFTAWNNGKTLLKRPADRRRQNADDNLDAQLSVAPYHENYKQMESGANTRPSDGLKPSQLASGYTTGREVNARILTNPAEGTVNRRKLFNRPHDAEK